MSRLYLAYFLHKSFFDVYIGTHRQTPDFCWSAYLYKTLIFCDGAKDEFFDDDTITPPVAAKIGELVDFFCQCHPWFVTRKSCNNSFRVKSSDKVSSLLFVFISLRLLQTDASIACMFELLTLFVGANSDLWCSI